MAIPTVRWVEWDRFELTAVSPGLVSLTAAVCLVICTGSEEKTVQSLNISTLLYIALYRYTMQVR